MPNFRILKKLPCSSSITETFIGFFSDKMLCDSFNSVLIDNIPIRFRDSRKHFRQLCRRIIFESEHFGETALQSWVRPQKLLHLVWVPRNDHRHTTSIVLHQCHHRRDCFSAEVLSVTLASCKCISLVNEKNSI